LPNDHARFCTAAVNFFWFMSGMHRLNAALHLPARRESPYLCFNKSNNQKPPGGAKDRNCGFRTRKEQTTMATQTLHPDFADDLSTGTGATSATQPLLARVLDFIVATQTARAQRAIAMHLRSRGLEFRPLDAEQPPH
jgi:hypothetical protein